MKFRQFISCSGKGYKIKLISLVVLFILAIVFFALMVSFFCPNIKTGMEYTKQISDSEGSFEIDGGYTECRRVQEQIYVFYNNGLCKSFYRTKYYFIGSNKKFAQRDAAASTGTYLSNRSRVIIFKDSMYGPQGVTDVLTISYNKLSDYKIPNTMGIIWTVFAGASIGGFITILIFTLRQYKNFAKKNSV